MDNYIPLSEASKLTGKHLKTIRRYIKTVSEQADIHGLLVKRIETPQGYSWLIRKDIISSFTGKKIDNKTYNTPLWVRHSPKNVHLDISKNVQVDKLNNNKAYSNDLEAHNGESSQVYNTPLWVRHSPKNVQVDKISSVHLDTANNEANVKNDRKNVQVDISKNVQVDKLTSVMADNMNAALSLLEKQLSEKDRQLQEKDKQISSLLERQRESHILINTQMKQIENGFASLSAQTERPVAQEIREQGSQRKKRVIQHTEKPKQFIQKKEKKQTETYSNTDQKPRGFISWFLGE